MIINVSKFYKFKVLSKNVSKDNSKDISKDISKDNTKDIAKDTLPLNNGQIYFQTEMPPLS